MKVIVSILLSVLLISCSASRGVVAEKSDVTLLSVPKTNQNDTTKDDLLEVGIRYNGITDGLYKFEYSVNNNSPDTVTVSPLAFHYTPISYQADSLNDKQQHIIQSVDPEKEIDQLHQRKDSLLNEVNPYSLYNKSVGTIVKEGLIAGTIATIFGQKDPESQRREDEDSWNENQKKKIMEIDRQIAFWQENKLKQVTLLPNQKIDGTVFFPVTQNVNEFEIELPIENKTFAFGFKQVN